MLTQWKYRVCKKFATIDGEIISGDDMKLIQGCKPFPDRFFLYKPSHRQYDYVDYTGRIKKQNATISEKTCILEMLGFIKFVSSKQIGTGYFT